MRYVRLFVMLMSVLILTFLSGCTKSWTVTFDDLSDVAGWICTAYGLDPNKSITVDGWLLDGYRATAPKLFTGDCTMTVEFELLCGDSMQVEKLGFYYAGYPGTQELGLMISNLGDSTDEEYDFMDNASADNTHTPVPGLRRIGTNTLRYSKKANEVRITMNGALVLSTDYSNYSEDYVVPKLEAYVYQGLAKVLFKSMKVTYSGEMVDI